MIRVTTLLLALLLLLATTDCTATEDTNNDAQIYAAAIREIHAITPSALIHARGG